MTDRDRQPPGSAASSRPATLAYIGSLAGLGLVNASLGPALPHLARHTGATIAAVSLVFAAYRCGYLIGSFAGGRLFDRVPGNLLMAGFLLLLAAGFGAVPVLGSLWLLLAVLVVAGTMGGAVDVGGTILLVWLGPKRLGSIMAVLHLAFGVGAFLSPLFLSQSLRLTGDIAWGYWALLVLVVVPGLRLLGVPSPRPAPTEGEDAEQRRPGRLVLLVSTFLLLYVGAEASFGGWIYSYALEMGIADEVRAGVLTSAFWGAYSVGRLVSALAALRLRSGTTLRAAMVGCLAGLATIIAAPDRELAVWIGTITFGFFIGPIFPAMVVYASEALKMTGRTTGLFFVGASVGAMIIPWSIGQFFESAGPSSVTSIVAAAILTAGVILRAIRMLVRDPARATARPG